MTQEENESRPGVVEHYRQNPEELLEDLRKYLTRGTNDALLARVLADLVKGSLLHLRAAMTSPEVSSISWSKPWMELRVPVAWDWEKGGILHVHHQEEDGRPALSFPLKTLEELKAGANPDPVAVLELLRSVYSPMGTRILALSGITGNVYTEKKGGELTGPRFLSPEAEEHVQACRAVLEEEERGLYLMSLLEPFSFFRPPETTNDPRMRDAPVLTTRWTRTHEGKPREDDVGVFCQAFPLVVDQDLREAFFPIVVGLLTREGTDTAEPMDLGTWPEEEREALFKAILVGTSQWVAEAWQAPTPPPKPTPSEELVPAGPPSPERMAKVRQTIAGPVPVARALQKSAHTTALARGLGKLFGSSSKVPDLDIKGEVATQEAESLLWACLENYLDTAGVTWKREANANGTVSYILQGKPEQEARELWRRFSPSLNAGDDRTGPGIKAEPPGFENETSWNAAAGEVASRTRLLFWPEPAVKRGWDGEPSPPVQFRQEGSPGYMALLGRHGPRPFFADGWLWIPRGREREGFCIGGLPHLLFPDGKAALERLAKRDLKDTEERLNRIFRNPSLFQDEDARVVRDFRASIRRARSWISTLSLYDTRDLVLCIFEAWYRQRDAWVKQAVTLEDGREVNTMPFRVIRLDPEDLRLRLDPNGTQANWRGFLFRKLEALTTFQRLTKNEKGRKIDVGDRLVERVIDGRQGVGEGAAPDHDIGLGLTRILKRAGGIPSKSFYTSVSVDFMERLVTWAQDEKGAIHWGLDAAKAAERAALLQGRPKKEAREEAQEKKETARKQPYYAHSSRLMMVYNLEAWPQDVKDFVQVLLEERTPPKRGGGGKGGRFVAYSGSHGKGYTVKAWIKKWGDHLLRTGPRGGVGAFSRFVEVLRFLASNETMGLELVLLPPKARVTKRTASVDEGRKQTRDALARLEAYASHPPTVYSLKLIPYLPTDLEARLRERLRAADIDAVDPGESTRSILTPSSPGPAGLSPADIRVARTRAGWKQADLAEKLGVSRVALSYWESGKKAVPTDRLARLREVLSPYLEDPEK